MIPIHHVCINAHARESVAAYLCYRYLGDRATCEVLAAAMEIDTQRPEMPEEVGQPDILADAATYAQDHDIAPLVEDPFALSRVRDVKTLIACMDRRRRYGHMLESIECDELGALLGSRPASLEEGLKTLDTAIRARRLDDAPLIQYLTRHAYRDEWLYAPAVALYPNRFWAEID
jgi:hypothetical protein